MIVRRPSWQYGIPSSSDCSIASSRKTPSLLVEGDDEKTMSSDESLPQQQHSAAVLSANILPSPRDTSPSGPYCPRRPTLHEILANTSPAPWTLAAFMAYLSNNHCLETLEFTMDAARYRKHYHKMLGKAAADSGLPPLKDREYVQALWHRLVEAYIMSNGSREVNLPSDVRDPLVYLPKGILPPAPETLDHAVAKTYELMEDSVLFPFLNSFYPPYAAHPAVCHSPTSCDLHPIMDDTVSIATSISSSGRPRFDAAHAKPRSIRSAAPDRSPPPPLSSAAFSRHLYTRKSAPVPLPPPAMQQQQQQQQQRSHPNRLAQSTSSPAAPVSESGRSDRTATYPHRQYQYQQQQQQYTAPSMTDDSGDGDNSSHYSPITASPTSPPNNSTSSSGNNRPVMGVWQKLGKLGRVKTGRKKGPSSVAGGGVDK